MTQLAFYRDFRRFSGGHMKVWDYYCHTQHSDHFRPTIYFTPDSLFDASNPWGAAGEPIEDSWDPGAADALFLGGLDWFAVPEDCTTPVINLVQHVRHSDPSDVRYGFLSRRAIRICVSQPVADAVLATGQANGPVLTIPAGLDPNPFPKPAAKRDIRVLIAGLKQPALAAELSATLADQGIPNVCLKKALPRQEFLRLLGLATVTVFLPHHQEGFYLPALEGMGMGTLVVCPDCVGNRQFCEAEVNCLMPDYNLESLVSEVLRSVAMDAPTLARLTSAGQKRQALHGLSKEREDFLQLLETIQPFAKT